ncbi:MAG: endolytic transglycosylase MltG [Candidatus Woesebacteria bacterium]|jgi:UPF0755 protein
MKKIGLVGAFLIVIIGSLLFTGYLWWNKNTKPLSSMEDFQTFVIPQGRSASQVGEMLYEKGLIRSPLAFKVYVQVFDKQRNINAGEFNLSPSMSLIELVEALQGGPLEVWVTIPEGLRRQQIAERFIDGLSKQGEESMIFREEFLQLTRDKEGYLFPDTYLFPPEASASAVVDKLVVTFDKRLDEEILEDISQSPYTKNQIVVVASIIEREAKSDDERPIVAGILWKRLETPGWLLQADATVQYGVASIDCRNDIDCDWWPSLTRQDLEIDSPYNSYKFDNLPPTPISNPGLASIRAALYPQESDYWYYLHNSEGQIHYARTLEEHNLNVSRYLGK